jgi:hypothetical protein
MKQASRLPDAILDKFTPDEVLSIIDWFIAKVEEQAPERRAEMRDHVARILRPAPKMHSF